MFNVVLLSRVLFISLLAYAANKVAASKMQVARQSENVESTFQNNYSRIIPGTILRERIKAFEAATELLANYKTLSTAISNDDDGISMQIQNILAILSDSLKKLLLQLTVDEQEIFFNRIEKSYNGRDNNNIINTVKNKADIKSTS